MAGDWGVSYHILPVCEMQSKCLALFGEAIRLRVYRDDKVNDAGFARLKYLMFVKLRHIYLIELRQLIQSQLIRPQVGIGGTPVGNGNGVLYPGAGQGEVHRRILDTVCGEGGFGRDVGLGAGFAW